ncbi:LPS export ABC transporter periplasmic protein LptC [Pseudothioclava nitratireducens]|uniref:LPS export ABC transporter periplasmic protein LptC n=1 Tax=Pseudothioclava nitratireducens TaxID=1928646 RepID=UPI0023DC7EC3|nr:LPS export ABC transporter periplasmic protein LptC [Defluviimonas nitratireducens]MDF1620465.1 LPS export ABC transporter periplasmic protein LptC [Defluviimonas nitratireducens]
MPNESRHSLIVTGAKIALPMIALALLSTLFMFSHKIDPSAAIPYAEVDVEQLARDAALIGPEYSGVTEEGASLAVRADRARPDPDGGRGAQAEQIVAKLEAPTGFVADLTARSGRIDPGGAEITLNDGVTLQTSTGYQIASDRIEMSLDNSHLLSPGPVTVIAPFGTLEAGRMELSADADSKLHDLVFNDRVKLVYSPVK